MPDGQWPPLQVGLGQIVRKLRCKRQIYGTPWGASPTTVKIVGFFVGDAALGVPSIAPLHSFRTVWGGYSRVENLRSLENEYVAGC